MSDVVCRHVRKVKSAVFRASEAAGSCQAAPIGEGPFREGSPDGAVRQDPAVFRAGSTGAIELPNKYLNSEGACVRALTLQEQVLQTEAQVLSPPDVNFCGFEGKRAPAKRRFGYIKACQQERWSLALWRKGEPQYKAFVRYRCRSWRCAGDCSRCNAAQWFARIKTAFDRLGAPERVSFIVLTLNPADWKPEGNRSAQDIMFLESNACWKLLAQMIRRRYGRFDFVTTIEQTQKGIPHFNIAVVSPAIAAELVGCGKGGAGSAFKNWLEAAAVSCGFGKICFAEPAKSSDAIAGYIVKVSGISALTGEITKTSQLPVDAPKGFRRIRSSVGFLPPKIKNQEVTGAMFFVPREGLESANEAAEEIRLLRARCSARLEKSYVNLDTGEVACDLFGEELK